MRWLGVGCLALGLTATAAWGQETPQLFAPAPKAPAQPAPVDARTVPVVRTSLSEPVPVPIPRPEIRRTLPESVAEPVAQRLPAPEAAPSPRPQYTPPPLTFADGVTATCPSSKHLGQSRA